MIKGNAHIKKRNLLIGTLVIGLIISAVLICTNFFAKEETASEKIDEAETVNQGRRNAQTDFDIYEEKIISDMTLEEKIYQLIFTTPESVAGVGEAIQAGEATRLALAEKPVGGIIYFSQNIKSRAQIAQMIKNTQSFSKIPLFIGVDEEGGRVARITGEENLGYEKIPPMAKIGQTGDEKQAYAVGKKLADVLGELNFNVDFAPVADIILNPNNTEIGDRSFGNNPTLTAQMVSEVVLGLQEGNISSVLKHFPGHGSTQANSHNGYSESTRTLEQMREEEFVPFKSGIDAGADFVLMSHMSAVKIDSSGTPSSLSKRIVTDLLKNELGYTGLIITDSLRMGAITERYSSGEAAVLAIEAGVDVLLMPEDVEAAYNGIYSAIKSGRLDEKRIDESVKKIIKLKLKRGIIQR